MERPPEVTHYEVLGILKSATPSDIRRAYKRRALETHPDKLGLQASDAEKEAAEAQFRSVCNAFEVLNDVKRRSAYDYTLAIKATQTASRIKFSEGQARLKKERDEWAQRLKEQQQQRVNAMRQASKSRSFQEPPAKPTAKASLYSAMVQEIIQELRTTSQEWLDRERLARQSQTPRARPAPRHSSTV
ncbi:hypothetical protein HGRIS_004769 [Hohenbuehelia grisea]|uniref:J domain-containing protein n=1 Tax=Hohenbuehelia grisea TaxID=104357 RepID=A0ABR3JD41_9AGAR